ncbi:MAG: hypothetical protein KC519_14715, partial [Anaerolineae bacterium]|nr:hypothetical protein [Anaerolineae bacterium]
PPANGDHQNVSNECEDCRERNVPVDRTGDYALNVLMSGFFQELTCNFSAGQETCTPAESNSDALYSVPPKIL